MDERWYVEHDGRVLVVEEDGERTLPAPGDVGVPTRRQAERELRGTRVVFAEAEVDEHPEAWPRKDALVHAPDSARLLRHAISASLFRPVVGVVVRREHGILLVKPRRGVAQGIWTLPGGFLHPFEQPPAGARREVREETGLEVEDLRLEATLTYSHLAQPYPILGMGFTARPTDPDALDVREEEIAEARWTPPDEAVEASHGLARRVLERLLEASP